MLPHGSSALFRLVKSFTQACIVHYATLVLYNNTPKTTLTISSINALVRAFNALFL